LILPGLGYGRAGEQTFRQLAVSIADAGINFYVADYVTRSGLDGSRAKLRRFLRDRDLHRYRRLHVFAFIAGAWTINPLVEFASLPNLATAVYDRSPYQERAPRIAAEKLRFLTWLRYGSSVFDLAGTPYPPLTASGVRVGLIVETAPTAFVKKHEAAARSYGPYSFACDAFGQRYDDCAYVAMNHDELYVRFAEIWPELLAFIRTGCFTRSANRTPPPGDPPAVRAGGPPACR
jgi:hypothetical protein